MPPDLQATPLPPNAPNTLPPLSSLSSSSSSPSTSDWVPVLSLPASPYPVDCFIDSLLSLIKFPEHSSSTILRADILQDETFDHEAESEGKGKHRAEEGRFEMEGYELQRRIRRKILPKRPQFDHAMEQDCLIYTRQHSTTNLDSPEDTTEALVLLVVDLNLLEQETGKREPPYYHPQVSTLAFRYLPASVSPSSSTSTLRIDILSLPSTPMTAPLDQQDRLFRTSISLLKLIDKMSKGSNTGYSKRIHHDLLVPKERVQDLYQQLKSKYTFLASSWIEKTDPSKHVFEDVAICAWLICLWEKMYTAKKSEKDGLERAEPEGGFVDIGCGNGLLVYLLNSEGYRGYGLDLRCRKSWSLYSPAPDLRLTSLSPPTLLRQSLSTSSPPFPANSFLIGNHADELTPWIPLFAALTPDSAYLNIPCCLHDLSGRFLPQTYTIPPDDLDSLPLPTSSLSSSALAIDTHPLLYPFYHPTPSSINDKSRYTSYQLFLAHLSLMCGFLPEREALRIPSTKNYGLVGRRRLWDDDGEGKEEGEKKVRREVERLLEEVEKKGGSEGWKARVPEGKAGEH